MSQDLYATLTEQYQQFVEPLSHMNQLMADNIGQISKLQLDSIQAYNDLGIEQLQSLASIKDAETFKNHGTKQIELMGKVGQRLLEDGQLISEMGQRFQQAAAEFAEVVHPKR